MCFITHPWWLSRWEWNYSYSVLWPFTWQGRLLCCTDVLWAEPEELLPTLPWWWEVWMTFRSGAFWEGLHALHPPGCFGRLLWGLFQIQILVVLLIFYRETNLKVRHALSVTSELGADINRLARFDGECFNRTNMSKPKSNIINHYLRSKLCFFSFVGRTLKICRHKSL